eukprot:6204342-Pyramimonas_sp.AAC.1
MQLSPVVLATPNMNARVAHPSLECAWRLSARSGGPFKREEESGCCVRGAENMRLGRCRRAGRQ